MNNPPWVVLRTIVPQGSYSRISGRSFLNGCCKTEPKRRHRFPGFVEPLCFYFADSLSRFLSRCNRSGDGGVPPTDIFCAREQPAKLASEARRCEQRSTSISAVGRANSVTVRGAMCAVQCDLRAFGAFIMRLVNGRVESVTCLDFSSILP